MPQSAPFLVDQEIPGDECWFRFIIHEKYINSDGTLSHQALKGTGAFSDAQAKPWAHELSGAIVSLAGKISDIQAAGEKMALDAQQKWIASHGKPSRKIYFAGAACASGQALKAVVEGIQTAAVYTPDPLIDPAHSDFVTYGSTTSASLDPVKDWLLFNLRVVRQNQLSQLANCGV
jgi:hypothetical protein